MEARVASTAEHGGGAGRVAVSAPARADAAIEAMWLATLQAIGARAAHELRGALNAVAVNLEVVRSRSEREGVLASSLTPYTQVAASQLEGVIAMTEALTHLVRAVRGPVDIGAELTRIADLLRPAAETSRRAIELDGSIGGLGTTPANTGSVRLAIGHCLLAATDASPNVRCLADARGDRPALRLQHGGDVVAIEAAATDALAAWGVDVRSEAGVIVITFPRS